MTTQIWCPIHEDWFDYLGGGMIPPDVIIEKSACGHNLPVTSETREIDGDPVDKVLTRIFEVDKSPRREYKNAKKNN